MHNLFQAQFYINENTAPVNTNCGDIQFPKDSPFQPDPSLSTPGLSITIEDSRQLEEATRDQCSSELWFKERRKRLTASQFGLVMKRRTITDKFIETLINPKQFSSAATGYGASNEKKALRAYILKTGYHTHTCGLLVNPNFPFLGASPDGKVCSDGKCGLIEVKCPFSARDMTIKEACGLKDFCLEDVDGHIKLKKCHNYMYQVQGQMLVSGAEFCDFVVFTKKELHIERVQFDQEFCQKLLTDLSAFYKCHIQPKL